MRKTIFAAALALATVGAISDVSAQAITVAVNCSRGQTIANALQQGDFRRPLLIKIQGVCQESIVITRENVTLRGDPSAAINAPNDNSDLITIEANGVKLEKLTLTGGLYGVRNNQSFRLQITDSVIQNTKSDGLRVFVGDTRLIRTTIQEAGGSGVFVSRGGSLAASNSHFVNNAGTGILANGNAIISASNGDISRNGGNGVQLDNASQGTFNGNTIESNGANPEEGRSGITVATGMLALSGNIIRNNPWDGVLVLSGANAWISNNTITNNGGNGIFGYLGTTINMEGDTVSGNGMGIFCNGNCTLQIGGATITGNASSGITVALGSKLIFAEPLTNGTGNDGADLWCADTESSVTNLSWFNGTSPNCTGFD